MESTEQRNISVNDLDVTTKESIEIEVPDMKQRIVVTITKRHYYDPMKKKVITDQVVHKARYSSKNKKKRSNSDDRGELI
ncbi:hypothetical protein H6503_06915 [Candidatus Woesearchaeota archaeon]|nr:hypothetical protein [Candidatus Woesearchaeota archaeon]